MLSVLSLLSFTQVVPLYKIPIGPEVLGVEIPIELVKDLLRLDKTRESSSCEEGVLVPLPTIAINQVVVERAVFVGVFKVQGSGFDRSHDVNKEQRLVE